MDIQPALHWRRYLALFGFTCTGVIAAVAAFNYRVDPYLIHQWQTEQVLQLRPAREKLAPWGKTYAVARYRPAVLYAGSSRTELGLPTEAAPLAGRPVFNAAMAGATLGDALAMVDHALQTGPPAAIILGIDAPTFTLEAGNTDFDRELVATDGWYLWRRRLIDLKRAVTVDMTLDSVRLLRGTFGAVCRSSLALHGQRDEVCIRDRIDGWGGTRAAIMPRVREFIRGPGPGADAMAAFDRTLGRACRAGTQLRVYINPTHAMTLDALYRAGKWPAMARWQRQLADVFEHHRDSGCDARIVDFSGFNHITMEPVPQAGGPETMTWYWETSHYRTNVGAIILARLLGDAGSTAAAPDFGVELGPQTVALHQARQRAGLARYHREHPLQTRMVSALMEEARLPQLPHPPR